MFYPTSSKKLFEPFAWGVPSSRQYASFIDAEKQADGEIPVILEVNGTSPEDISFIHVKSDDEWIMMSPNKVKELVASVTPSTVYKTIVAMVNKGETLSWNWSCPVDEIDELKSAIQDAISPANKEFASLPPPLNYHFALADIKPEFRVDSERNKISAMVDVRGDWPWHKTAAVTMEVTPIGDDGIDAHFGLQDLDRTATDRFECYVSLAKSISGYDIGFQINAGQLGIASNIHYWHYRPNEYKAAKETFHEIKKATHDYIKDHELKKSPFSLLGPKLKSILASIDIEHRETTGVFLIQESFRLPVEDDWRTTLYGDRYPSYSVGNMSEGFFSTPNTYKQDEQKSQTIDVDNAENPRQTTYKLTYASADPRMHPVLKRAAISNFQKWLQNIIHTPVPNAVATRLLSVVDQQTMPEFLENMGKNPIQTLVTYLR